MTDKIWHQMTIKHADQSSAYKQYRRAWKINPERHIVGNFPLNLDIETVTNCNLRCKMCYQSYAPVDREEMSLQLYYKILKEAKYWKLPAIKFQFRGEPLCDNQLPLFISLAKEVGVIETIINTNATLLTEKVGQKLINAGLDRIICSVDGYDAKTYENIRVGAKFEKVKKNILNFIKLRGDNPKPYITLRTIKMDGIDPQKYQEYWEPYADQIGYADLVDQTIREVEKPPADFTCPQLWQRLIILADGTALPCCAAFDGHAIHFNLGNVNYESIHSIWTGERLNALRELHQSGLSHEVHICRHCRFKGFRGI